MAPDPFRQAQQTHQRNAVDLADMFTDAQDQAFARSAEIPATPVIRSAVALENPLNAARARDDTPAPIQYGNDAAVVVISFGEQPARNRADSRFGGWPSVREPSTWWDRLAPLIFVGRSAIDVLHRRFPFKLAG